MARLGDTLRRASLRLAMAAVLGLLGLALATTADVLMRWLFRQPIIGLGDAVTVAGAVCLAACMPWVVASRGHIVVDLLGKVAGARARRALDAFGAALTCAFFAVLAWRYVDFVADMYRNGDVTPVLRWATWPWWAAVAACIAFTGLVGAATLLDRDATR